MLGYSFNRHFSGYIGYGNVLASSGDADEWTVRSQRIYSF